MGDPWGIGGFRGGGEKPNIKHWQIVKKTFKKSQKSAKLGKIEKIRFFTENGLKCISNPTKHLQKSTICQKKHKIGEIGKKSEKSDFFTENGLKCIRNPTKYL